MKLHCALALLILAVSLFVIKTIDAKKSVSGTPTEPVEIVYSNQEELEKKLKKLNNEKLSNPDFDEISPKEMQKLKDAEVGLKKNVLRALRDFGKHSKERATALHALGGNIYKQGRYEELMTLSKEIVAIHESLDGPEHENTGKALGNLGSVACRLFKMRECGLAMNRQLYILLSIYGDNSKEVLLQRGRMLSFKVPDGETSVGISYADYLEEIEEEL
jgi:hypothetical protein